MIAFAYWYAQLRVTFVDDVPQMFVEPAEASSALIASTAYGKVQGEKLDGGVIRFNRIPFASPPTGSRRFSRPEEPLPWSGILDARPLGPSCLQEVTIFSDAAARFQSEDCLSLVVNTPSIDKQKRPVIVYIHGGGYVIGGALEELTDGRSFTENGDVVFVNLQYRLGALGWLDLSHLGEEEAKRTALNGRRDVLAGLKWVHENIENFGGDPENVTIMGESAGAFLVYTMLQTPEALPLFDKAILQSGVIEYWEFPADRAEFARHLLDQFRVSSLSELRRLSTEDLVRLESETYAYARQIGYADPMPWYGLRGTSEQAMLSAGRHGKPVLHGTLMHEYHLFLLAFDDKPVQARCKPRIWSP